MSKWTGPALPERVPRAAASTRHTALRHWLFCSSKRMPRCDSSPASSARPRLIAARTWLPNSPNCSTVWLAPVPSISYGRLALSTISGMRA